MSRPRSQRLLAARFLAAGLVVAAAALSACLVLVEPGEAVVVTRFGDPVRVLTHPGLGWRLPAPLEATTRVDLRLRTTTSGLQDVGSRDGLRVLMQAYAAWQVPADPQRIRQFLRALGNQPDEAAEQLRSFIGSALQTTAGRFDLSGLVNTDPARIRLDAFEGELRRHLEADVLSTYGITIRQVGLDRLSLPPEALDATVARMRAERMTVATQREAEGTRAAAEIRTTADRDARIALSEAHVQAADIEAKSRLEAADIYGRAYAGNPKLYTLLRSLDTLDTVMGSNTRIILRTDAAPFRAFVEGPDGPPPSDPAAAPPRGPSPVASGAATP